jgi:hypothetical protein
MLDLLQLLHVRAHPRSFTPGKVGTEAAHRSAEILAGIGILVVALAILQPLSTWLAKRYPIPELSETAPHSG